MVKFAEFCPLSVAISSEGLCLRLPQAGCVLRPCVAAALFGSCRTCSSEQIRRGPVLLVLKMAGAVENVKADLLHLMDQSVVPAEIQKGFVRGWDPVREGVRRRCSRRKSCGRFCRRIVVLTSLHLCESRWRR